MRTVRVIAAATATAWLNASATAQQPEEPRTESPKAVAERIRGGAWFEQSRFRRADDGTLEVFRLPGGRDGEPEGFVPLLTENAFEDGAVGVLGFLTIVCHGNGDLLGMTDAGFHFGALGVDGSDAGLRQFLALPPPPFDDARGRAELLDRLLAIDVLVRRGCRAAASELRSLASDDERPAVLRERARQGVDALNGTAAHLERRRLDARAVRLPAAFDGCIVVDHSRLPDMSWLPAFKRRLAALSIAEACELAAIEQTPADRNLSQRICDLPSELPFDLAHRYGNARVDHSLVVVTVKAGGRWPFALTWEAAGEIEHEGWQRAQVSKAGARLNPLLAGTMRITTDHVLASTDSSEGKPRPELAAELGIDNDDGIAIRAVLPASSKAWPALASEKAPPANGAELRITFGDPAVIVLAVDARDEGTAAEWIETGKRWCKELRAARDQWPEAVRQNKELAPVLEAGLNPAFSTKANHAFAVIELRGMTPEKVQAILLLLLAQRG